MKQFVSAGAALAISLCAFGIAGADDKMGDAMSSSKMSTVKLSAQNGSGETGTATLTQSADGLVVKLNLVGGTGDQPAHIHKGTCAKLDPAPAFPLTTVSDGKSETTLKDAKLSTLMAGTYAINVHKSTTDLKDYVTCGDLKVAGAM